MHRPQQAVSIRLGCYHRAPEGRHQPDSSQSTFLSPGAATVRWRFESGIDVVEMRQRPKKLREGMEHVTSSRRRVTVTGGKVQAIAA